MSNKMLIAYMSFQRHSLSVSILAAFLAGQLIELASRLPLAIHVFTYFNGFKDSNGGPSIEMNMSDEM